MPCVIMVDSRATTARLSERASATSCPRSSSPSECFSCFPMSFTERCHQFDFTDDCRVEVCKPLSSNPILRVPATTRALNFKLGYEISSDRKTHDEPDPLA